VMFLVSMIIVFSLVQQEISGQVRSFYTERYGSNKYYNCICCFGALISFAVYPFSSNNNNNKVCYAVCLGLLMCKRAGEREQLNFQFHFQFSY